MIQFLMDNIQQCGLFILFGAIIGVLIENIWRIRRIEKHLGIRKKKSKDNTKN